jgi:hypothetical protein
MIPLTGEKSGHTFIEDNGKIIKISYDGQGNLKNFFLVENKEQEKPSGQKFVVKDFEKGLSDYTGAEGGYGYFSLATLTPGTVAIKFGTTFEGTEQNIKECSFAEWTDECARVMLGLQGGFK